MKQLYRSHFITTIAVFAFNLALGQWRTVYMENEITNQLYSLRSTGYFSDEEFYFPPYEYLEEALTDGVSLAENAGNNIDNKELNGLDADGLAWEITFKPTLNFHTDSTKFYQRSYTSNVTSYSIHLYIDDLDKWFSKEFQISHQGYQIPIETDFEDWSEELNGTYQVSKILFTIDNEANGVTDVIFGDFKIMNGYDKLVEAYQPFINRLYDVDPLIGYDITNPVRYSESLIARAPEAFSACEHCRGSYNMMNSNDESEAPIVVRLLKEALEYYPYYKEKSLDKTDIYNNFNLILQKYPNFEPEKRLINDLKDLVFNTFHDPHFKIEVPTKKKVAGIFPIRLFEIDQKIYVAASFDESLDQFINKQVSHVNGIQAANLLDSLISHQYGSPDRRKRIAMTQLTEGFEQSELTITLEDKDRQETLNLVRTRRPRVPSSFRAKSLEFKILDNEVAYFRILKWELGVFLSFLNHWEDITNAKGLIIDLRNNGGGESIAVKRMFSLFITDASPINYSLSYLGNKIETTVINPNKKFHYASDKQVIILGNELTGCASEEFILAMTQLNNCQFLSGSLTGGSLASVYDFYFPSGLRFRTNSAADKNYFFDEKIIEDRGIEPDIWIKYSSIYDLAPYNDTLLNKGVEIIKSQN